MKSQFRLSVFTFLFFSSLSSLAQENTFLFNGIADVIFKYPPRGTGGRAFVHDSGNVLTLNYGGDFSGGTRIGSNVNFDVNGNVHIGTIYEKGSLTVAGLAIVGNAGGANYNENLRLPSANSGFASIALGAVPGIEGTGQGQWTLVKFPESFQSRFSIRHVNDDYFSILTNGNIGIGTNNPSAKLAVEGNIKAREIKVESAAWPDYVFEKAYQLPSLKEIERHIQKKGHLPGIPSAKEVKANGIELGEMNAKLLQKIEELTLHLIDKDKQLNEVKAINDEYGKRLRDLESKMNLLLIK